jgi:sugar O-acyltransferase (sialic acid O-acetyltransferase NeuD family)
MMISVVIPQEDVNSETATLVAWLVEDAAPVKRGQPICEVETSKVVFEVAATADGWLVRSSEEGEEVRFNVPIGFIVETSDALADAHAHRRAPLAELPAVVELHNFPGKITERARRLIEEHGISTSQLPQKSVITERDILPLLDAKEDFFSPIDQRVYPLDHVGVRVQRTLVLGAGLGAMQVVDILSHDPRVQVVGYVDDNVELHGKTVYGLPILGPSNLAEEWFRAGRYDAAIISVSTSNYVRRRWYEWLKRIGVPLINAIDPTAKLNRGAMLGEGNIVCAFVHVGVETRIGNNNFLSAYTSVDHHNLWGSHITTGPAVATSGCVQVEDDVKMGTGIFIQPHITIGRGAQIASGAVLTRSVPELYVAKTRVNTELTPVREPSRGPRSTHHGDQMDGGA